MTISVALPEAWQAFNAEVQQQSTTHNDQCWDVVGEPLNTPIRKTIPEYYRKLELGDEHVAMSKRGEILDLYWGRIEQDGAALKGLGKALENLSGMISENVKTLAEHWSGASYDAFKTAMGKIQTTLDAYSAAAIKVGDVMITAMTQIRSMYETYATTSQETLTFDWISPPEHWHKLDDKAAGNFALWCPSGMLGCEKADGQAVALLKGKFVTSLQMNACTADPCENDLDRVLAMYGNMVRHGEEGRDKIRARVDVWRKATDQLKTDVESVLKIAVDNVYKLSKSNAFGGLRVIAGGGQPAGGGEVSDSGYPGGGGGGGYPVSGGGYPGGAPSAEPIVDPTTAVEPAPEPAPEPEPATAAADPAATDPAAQIPDPATVSITDGDRTIGVSNPGVEGHVKVTVTGADGVTKTYDLDFDAASGLGPRADAAPAAEEGVEQVPARSDGKCVIKDGDVTITAERPLFAPDQITLTVDDGTGSTATYTVDFPDEQQADAEEATPADAKAAGAVAPGPAANAQATAVGEPIAEQAPEPADDTGDAAAAESETAQAADATSAPVADKPAAVDDAPEAATTSTADVRTNGAATETQPGATTSPQSWMEEAKGSVSGVLVPDQPAGEAGLGEAADSEEPQADTATGMAGAGLPMSGGGTGNASGEPGRVGSGWSVHGDLFDSGEPVYSMHGVLGDEDTERSDG